MGVYRMCVCFRPIYSYKSRTNTSTAGLLFETLHVVRVQQYNTSTNAGYNVTRTSTHRSIHRNKYHMADTIHFDGGMRTPEIKERAKSA